MTKRELKIKAIQSLLEKYTGKKVTLKEDPLLGRGMSSDARNRDVEESDREYIASKQKAERQLKANVIAVGVVNMTNGQTGHGWSIYENQGLYAFLMTRDYLLFGTKDSLKIGDTVTLLSNEGRKLGKTDKVIDISSCNKEELLQMLKRNRYDYYPIKAFRARPQGNRKLGTSYSIKGVSLLNESKKKLKEGLGNKIRVFKNSKMKEYIKDVEPSEIEQRSKDIKVKTFYETYLVNFVILKDGDEGFIWSKNQTLDN